MRKLPTRRSQLETMTEAELRQALDDALFTLSDLNYWMNHPVSVVRRLRTHPRLLTVLTEEIGELAMKENEDVPWEVIGRKALNAMESRCPRLWRLH